MALYIPHSIFHLARLLYVRPETFGPYYVHNLVVNREFPAFYATWSPWPCLLAPTMAWLMSQLNQFHSSYMNHRNVVSIRFFSKKMNFGLSLGVVKESLVRVICVSLDWYWFEMNGEFCLSAGVKTWIEQKGSMPFPPEVWYRSLPTGSVI